MYTMTKNEYLSFLEGYEILSIYFGGTIGVFQGKIWQDGKIIDAKPTKKILKILTDELIKQELG